MIDDYSRDILKIQRHAVASILIEEGKRAGHLSEDDDGAM